MEIYISYSWAPPIKAIVKHWLCPVLETNHIDYIRDEKNCGYGDDIIEFEKEIGKADNVLIMVSEKYFFSRNCMFELALIMKDSRFGKNRLWVSADDFSRKDDYFRSIYDYWKAEKERYEKELTGDENRDSICHEKIKIIQLILEYFPLAWKQIVDKNTKSFEKVSENNFQELLDYIKNKIKIDDEIVEVSNDDLPIDVGETPKGVSILQYGDKNIAQIITEGTVMINM